MLMVDIRSMKVESRTVFEKWEDEAKSFSFRKSTKDYEASLGTAKIRICTNKASEKDKLIWSSDDDDDQVNLRTYLMDFLFVVSKSLDLLSNPWTRYRY